MENKFFKVIIKDFKNDCVLETFYYKNYENAQAKKQALEQQFIDDDDIIIIIYNCYFKD